eukprot:9480959-Pyramimonas_sp.AAC.1
MSACLSAPGRPRPWPRRARRRRPKGNHPGGPTTGLGRPRPEPPGHRAQGLRPDRTQGRVNLAPRTGPAPVLMDLARL